MEHSNKSQNDIINLASSQFRSKDLELNFRQSTLAEDKKRGIVLILASLIVVVLIFIDYIILGTSDFFFKITAIRCFGILFSIVILYLFLRTESVNNFDFILFVFVTFLSLENVYIGNLRPSNYTPSATFDVILIMAVYIIMPTRTIFKIIPCLIISLLSPSLRTASTSMEFFGLIVAHFSSHLIGFIFSNILNKNRRIQYRLLLNEIRLKKNLEKTEKEIIFISQRLSIQNKELKESATIDQLTGIYNRRALYEFAEEQWSRAVRNNEEFSVILLDIDHFKNVNDTYGHQVGDIVLKGIASSLTPLNREYDRLGRWGGEEFMLFLPGTTIEQALIIAERLRCKASAPVFRVSDELEINITISLGISSKTLSKALELDVLIDQADKALYEAKETGRNKACAFQGQHE